MRFWRSRRRAISGLAVGRRRSKTFTPDMSLPRRFAPRAMSSRRCPGLLSWISQRANMARQRHLKISCDRLTATLVTPAVCQTSAYQENKFGRFLPISVACAKHASFAFMSTAGAMFQLCRERVSLNHCSSASMSELGGVKTNGPGGARQQLRGALGAEPDMDIS